MLVNRHIFVLMVLFVMGCASSDPVAPTADTGTDSNFSPDPDMGEDSGDTDVVDPDMPIDEPDFGRPVEDLIVEVSGAKNRVLLKGIVLAPQGVIDPGQVLIEDGFIRCVESDCEGQAGAQGATVIETHGVISPGLIDAHNHLPYNFLGEWDAGGQFFDNRYQWSDEPSYEAHIAPYAANRASGTHYCPAAKWGEWRSLMNGTTTVQGQSFNQNCVGGWVRNADHEHGLQYDHLRTTIASPRDINDDTAQSYIDSFDEAVNPVTRLAVHMGEGISGDNVELEFDSFAGRDPRSNRHAGVSLLYKETAILIHSIAVTPSHIQEIAQTNSKVVWSPSSNFVLYGQTADIVAMIQAGITIGIGPDWTVSGEDNLPSEMRYALEYAEQTSIDDVVTAKKVWEMVTVEGAEVVGLTEFVGRLEPGLRADIAVFAARRDDPYESVAYARTQDVRLVFISGEAYFGDAAARESIARNDGCETVDMCDQEKFFCAMDNDISEGGRTLGDVEQQLVDILEGTGYPADEQYGRGDELLPLWSCQ